MACRKVSRFPHWSTALFLALILYPSESLSQQVGTTEHKEPAQNIQKAPAEEPEQPAPFQAQILETIGRIADRQKTAQEENNASQKSWDSPPVLINIGLLIVGAAYTLFAGFQWWAIRKQAKIAADNVIATKQLANLERPWLLAIRREKAPDSGWPPGNEGSDFRIVWDAKNFGKSPAFVTFLFSVIKILDLPILGEPPEPKESEINQMVIPPGESYPRPTKRHITSDEAAEVKTGKKCIVFFGLIKYESRLGETKPHHSKFCEYWFYEDGRPEEPKIGPKGWVEYT
jgi:hypothetical protein